MLWNMSHTGSWATSVHPVQVHTLEFIARKTFSCFLPAFRMPDSTDCFQFNRGTNTTLSQCSVGKSLSFSSVQEQMTLGGLCKTSFYFDLSIFTGLFPCLVEYHPAGWECFLLIYWYLYLKVHLSAAVVNSPLVSQTLSLMSFLQKADQRWSGAERERMLNFKVQ